MEELNPTLSLLTLTVITLSLGNVICQYEDCPRPFVCGSPTPIEFRYPFWGGERPDYCGRSGFGLTCINNIARLNISSASYRVLWIDNSTQTLRIARDDLSNTLCPSNLVNTDLDFSLFDFSYDYRDQNITLLYDCGISRTTPDAPPVHNRFSCPVDGSTTLTWSYYLTTELIGVWRNVTEACDRNITVPVNGDAAVTLATLGVDSVSVLQRALAHGFWIRWRTDNDRCGDCAGSGGLCGRNLSSGSFACYCGDGSTRNSRCNDTPSHSGNGNGSGIRIGLPIGGAVLAVGIGVGWLVFHRRQRRKKRVERLGSNFNRRALSFTTTSNSDLGWCSTYNGAQVFDYTELEQATNNFSRVLGDGGFGTVYYGTLSDGRVVAVKRLYENNFKRVEQFTNEVKILTGLRHKNLVSLYGSTSHHSRRLLLVYEFVPNGTVADHLHGARRATLPWPVRLDIAVETAEALDYLHKSEIIHRDVKTANLLLDMGFHVKVADFGLSRLFPTDVTHVSTAPQGTPGYVDPEYHQCYQLTEKSDVYSFGVVLVELMSSLVAVDTSRHRHDVNLASMAVNKIQKGEVEELVDPGLGFGTDGGVRRAMMGVAKLAFRCLQCEREMRPAMWEVVAGLKRIREEGVGSSHAVEVVDMRDDDDGGPLREAVETPSLSPPDSGSAQMSY